MSRFFNRHFEWMALAMGLIIIAVMNPYADNGASLCLLDWIGFSFCPGDGLGHSIAYFVRGDFYAALQANVMGPAAIIIITGRILYLVRGTYIEKAK